MLWIAANGSTTVVVEHSTDWWVAVAGFVLAAVTAVAVLVALKTFRALLREAVATEKSVSAIRDSQLADRRPYLIEDGAARPAISGDLMNCALDLKNVGRGMALIEAESASGLPFAEVRETPNLSWRRCKADRRVLLPLEKLQIETGMTKATRREDNAPPRIYVRVRYTDMDGDQLGTTYLTVVEYQEKEWRLDGVAQVDATGQPFVQSGGAWGAWSNFVPEDGAEPWPE